MAAACHGRHHHRRAGRADRLHPARRCADRADRGRVRPAGFGRAHETQARGAQARRGAATRGPCRTAPGSRRPPRDWRHEHAPGLGRLPAVGARGDLRSPTGRGVVDAGRRSRGWRRWPRPAPPATPPCTAGSPRGTRHVPTYRRSGIHLHRDAVGGQHTPVDHVGEFLPRHRPPGPGRRRRAQPRRPQLLVRGSAVIGHHRYRLPVRGRQRLRQPCGPCRAVVAGAAVPASVGEASPAVPTPGMPRSAW